MNIGEFFATNVTGGALLLAMLLALIAGIVSFLSPCILPLVPGYLGYVSGLSNPNEPGNRRRVLTGVTLFILGFAAVFTLYGAAFGLVGSWLLRWQDLLMRILGVVVILMGLVLLGGFCWLQQTRKLNLAHRTGLGGAPVLGVVFGLCWVTRVLGLVRGHIRIVNIVGAAMLIALGLMMVTGLWMRWIYQLQNLAGMFITPV